ncbi:sensor histidine kinase [Cochlodiniinecator piscidefendens]|uniref:sensor histidine kinase n=1 Tax=Cochlodiniinecator piscidefendens TaxID=2715756 RepID=UPI0014099FA1|nr:sensor histidine kinase [Cochlodiniinecator piscidefendens]
MTRVLHITGSVRRKLMLQLVGSAAILAFGLYLLVQNFAQNVAEETQDNTLIASVTSVLDSVAVQSGAIVVDIPYSAFSMLGNTSNDRVFYKIEANGAFLTGYDDLPSAQSDGRSTGVLTTPYRGESVRIATAQRHLALADGPTLVTVSIAQTRNGLTQILARISKAALIFGSGFFVVATLLAVLTARSTVKPLQQLATSVSRRGPKDLRPVNAPVPTEMAPLVGSLNQFIKRLKVSLTRSEDFIAEAAHRVRTPLATVRAQADVVLQRVEKPENRKSLRDMIRAIDESSRAAGQLLDHAMVTFRTDHLASEEINLTELTAELVNQLRPVAGLKDIQFIVTHSPLPPIKGDAILLQNAVRNILDNAIKYSGADSDIEISFSHTDQNCVLQVKDSGVGLPTDKIETLTGRFVRGANVSETVGSGLGLTIANEVMRAHGGALQIRNNEKGSGACVSLHFPHS